MHDQAFFSHNPSVGLTREGNGIKPDKFSLHCHVRDRKPVISGFSRLFEKAGVNESPTTDAEGVILSITVFAKGDGKKMIPFETGF